MNQSLNVELTIPIPADKVLISKVELEELKEQSLSGIYWTMKDLESRVGKKQEWIKNNILYSPKFKEKLDARNGGPVYYPESQGQTWCFQAKEMARFLDENFKKIFGR